MHSRNNGVAEINRRILQEVACAGSWGEVSDILHIHGSYYFALAPREREQLNTQIKDLMQERLPE
jgi:hypothetical protein